MSTRTSSLGLGLVLVAAIAAAGAADAAITRVSMKGGLSLATLHGDLPTSPFVPNDYRSSGGGGVAVTLGSEGPWSFQPEVLYVSKGTSYGKSELTNSSGGVLGTIETALVMNYLEFPLLARLGFRQREAVSPYLLAGPTFGFRTSQDFQISGALQASTGIDFFRPGDLGVALGSGLEVGRGAYRGLLEARYTLGLLNTAHDTYSSNARNEDLLVMAGLAFRP